ncbi:MAG TPA: CDP-archaeol synthase [Verrucomicrobiales bacterium]|jgi:phosphatidate cytidylyltransferase|nr:CDP-archaeol synthase [Verrucomicrobiales bacterium]
MPESPPPSPPTKAQVFAKRLTSTLALWVLVAAAIVLGQSWLFFILLGFLGMSGVLEYAKMDATLPKPWRVGFIVISAAFMAGTFAICQVNKRDWPIEVDAAFIALAAMAAFVPALFRPLEGRATLWAIVYTLAGFVYVPWMWSFMTRLLFARGLDSGGHVIGVPELLFVVAATKFTDCGAYAVGSLFGKHKMIPHVSPGKTWEGVPGAFLGALVAGMAVYWGYGSARMGFSVTHAIILCLILAAVCIVGDLAESILKRCLGVKDSGRMLPGIGGALDLIDSLLWTGPVYYFYLKYVCAA